MLPVGWQQVLQKIQTVFPEAVIAGGALRDLDNGTAVKDIDIFIQHRGPSTFEVLQLLLRDTLVGSRILSEAASDYMDSLADVAEVYTFDRELSFNPPFQVISLNMTVTPDAMINRIDFGLCRLAHNGDQLFVSDAYSKDKSSKTFTLLRCENDDQYHRSMGRYDRLVEKFPGFSLDTSSYTGTN